MTIITNPGPCRECTLSIEITLVNWNNEIVPLYSDGMDERTSGIYEIICFGEQTVFHHDFHKQKTLRINGIHAGVAKLRFCGNFKDIVHSAGYIPVPKYDDKDIELGNGTEGKGGESKSKASFPGVQNGFHILDNSRTGWQNFAGDTTPPDQPLTYDENYWRSHAERDSHAAGHYFHRLCYWKIFSDESIELELLVDANAKDGCTRHTIELIGRYSYIPALAPHMKEFSFVNAVNLCMLGILAGSMSLEQNEDSDNAGSPEDVFGELAEARRPKQVNDFNKAEMILQLVPYHRRYQDITHLLDEDTEFKILLASNDDTILIACGGLSKHCYAGDKDKTYQSAQKKAPVGIYMDICSSFGVTSPILKFNDKIHKYIKDHGQTKDICIAGSSFGGGVATLIISEINSSFLYTPLRDILSKTTHYPLLYTFGMPLVMKITDEGLQRLNCLAHHRVVQSGDYLPWIPSGAKILDLFPALLHAWKAFYEARRGNLNDAVRDLFDAVHALKWETIYYREWGSVAKNISDGKSGGGITMQPISYRLQLNDIYDFLRTTPLKGEESEIFDEVFAECKEKNDPRSYAMLIYKELGDVFHHSLTFEVQFNKRTKITRNEINRIHNILKDEERSPDNNIRQRAKQDLVGIQKDISFINKNSAIYGSFSWPSKNGWNFLQELVLHFPIYY
jgi:hypothetical protein